MGKTNGYRYGFVFMVATLYKLFLSMKYNCHLPSGSSDLTLDLLGYCPRNAWDPL